MVTKKIKIILVNMFLIIMFMGSNAFAIDLEVKTTKQYDEWNNLSIEEKKENLMPRTISTSFPKEIINKYDYTAPKMLSFFVKGINTDLTNNVGASNTDSRYNMADVLDLRVENQGETYECWAFSTIKSLETNYAIINGENTIENFSERHMDYSLSQSFNDGVNEKGLDRQVSEGGQPISGLSYLASGRGAVLEQNMPFENNKNKISLSEIEKPVDTIVTGYEVIPSINKEYEYDSNGNTVSVKYYNLEGEEYTTQELKAVRNIIKENIIKYGAISTMTVGDIDKYYSNPSNKFLSKAYNCNSSNEKRDHALTIVGWDDNYSKDNFAEGTKPSTNGAYIVLNSYGEGVFNNGYLYVSYEDFYIEDEMYSITSSKKVDYDNIYQYDDFGGLFTIGTNSADKGFIGNVYSRDISNKEILKSVGITIPNYSKVNIYVNPTSSNMNISNCTKVYTGDDYLSPGYHRVDIENIELTSNEFSIIVEQISLDNTFFFSVETSQEGTSYKNVTSEGKSYYSLNGSDWTNLNVVNTDIELENGDVCIKGFTVLKSDDEPDPQPDPQPEPISISSSTYKLDNNYIMGVSYNTNIEKFLSNISTNSTTKQIYDDNEEITNSSAIVKTGMKIKLSNGDEYVIIVKGDIKEDGKITLTDLSKLVAHYNEIKNMELKGNSLKAADLNLDGIINLVDISQLIIIYNVI